MYALLRFCWYACIIEGNRAIFEFETGKFTTAENGRVKKASERSVRFHFSAVICVLFATKAANIGFFGIGDMPVVGLAACMAKSAAHMDQRTWSRESGSGSPNSIGNWRPKEEIVACACTDSGSATLAICYARRVAERIVGRPRWLGNYSAELKIPLYCNSNLRQQAPPQPVICGQYPAFACLSRF